MSSKHIKKLKNCNLYVYYQIGQDPKFQLEMYNLDDPTRDIFKKYYESSNFLLFQTLLLPQCASSKKHNENENEYHPDEVINTSLILKETEIAPLTHWMDIKRYYKSGRNWKNVKSYTAKFKVEIYQHIIDNTFLILFWNEFDLQCEIYVI